MNFSLDFAIQFDDVAVSLSDLLDNIEKYQTQLQDISLLQGRMLVTLDGELQNVAYEESFLRLSEHWLRSLQWIMVGDTETIAFHNSEHCYCFIPVRQRIEFSLYLGTDAEVDQYVIEPVSLEPDAFFMSSLALGEMILRLINTLDPQLLTNNEDCKELAESLAEAKRVWAKEKNGSQY